MSKDKIKAAAGVICKQGPVQFPVNDITEEIISLVAGENEDALELVCAFSDMPSKTMDQILASTNLPEGRIESAADFLAKKGLLFNQPNSKGVMVYRILPLMTVGLMEYTFMGELKGDATEKRLAFLFEELLLRLKEDVQNNYHQLVPLFESSPPIDRTVPVRRKEGDQGIRIIKVDKSIEIPQEMVLPSQSVDEIIDKYDDIAVGRCFCRQRRKMLGEPCASDAPMMNCFTFGKSARHTTAQGFARPVSKEEARRIMREAEEAGLVHKAFHPGSRIDRPETSICNCCKDCCDTFRLFREGALPLSNATHHLAVPDKDLCTGCGTCTDYCPTDAVEIKIDGTSGVDEKMCIGCGLCARFCPEDAMALKEGFRKVLVLPPQRPGT